MPAFNYEASNDLGNITRGVIEADSERHVRLQLKSNGLLTLSCTLITQQSREQKTTTAQPPIWLKSLTDRSALSAVKRTLLMRQLASLSQAGLPQEQALTVLLSQAENKSEQEILGAIRSKILEGSSLSQALAQYPATFASELIAMIAAGEQSGKLSLVLENWADYLEARANLKQQVVASLAYPAIVAVVALLMVLGLMTYVVPQIVGVFKNAKTALPLLTQIMMAASNFLRSYGIYLLLAMIATVMLIRIILKMPAPKLAFHSFLLRMPLVGNLMQAAQTERFASTLAILIRGGVPMLDALNAAKRTLTNKVLINQLDSTITHVQSGATLARGITLSQNKASPKERMANLLTHLIASGEATGKLPDMLTRAAQLQGAILSRKLQALTTILEPAIILVMGGAVLVIVLSVLLPIIEINALVK
ncbi:MAG: ral secretion pathway protein [Pseudomonadota bacterium]|jgi:general secretion pathway protein F